MTIHETYHSYVLKAFCVLLFFICIGNSTKAKSSTDSLISVLKSELLNKAKYDKLKESKIRKLKVELSKVKQDNLMEIYHINDNLLNEYLSYQRDSAIIIADRLIGIGELLNNQRLINSSRLKLAGILISSGVFLDASNCLSLIDVKNEMPDHKYEYYHLYTWLYWAMQTSIADKLYSPEYLKKEILYRDSAALFANPKKYELDLLGIFPNKGKLNSDQDYEEYLKRLNDIFRTSPQIAKRLAYVYSDLFTGEHSTDMLILAAIFDVKTATKETPAIIKMADHLNKKGDINNAYYFLQEALENANFYGSKLHKIEITSLLPEVASQKMLLNQRKIMFVIIFAIVLIFILALVGFSRIKLKKMNQKISAQNIKLNNTLQALDKSKKEKTLILNVLAHDLRNTIVGSLNVNSVLIQNNHIDNDEKLMLKLLNSSNQDSLATISDLLNLNVFGTEINKSPIDLSVLVNETAELFQLKANEKNQKIIVQTKDIKIPINREKIRRVLHNLLSNANKFSLPGTEIHVELDDYESEFALIKISDQGIGIPEEYRDSIFDLKSNYRKEGTEGEQSFGFGLYICKQIIEEHQGKIWIESNLDQGTIFFILLPKN